MRKRNLRTGGRILYIPIEMLHSHPLKSRLYFNNEELVDLCASICDEGIIKPLTVFEAENGYYVIISGERRFRAAKLAELKELPCILIKSTEEDSAFMSITENIQQSTLNYFELPLAVEKIHNTYSVSYTEIAERLGISIIDLTDKLKLLSIPDYLRITLIENGITEKHAREIIKLNDSEKDTLVNEITKKKLNVTQTRQRVSEILYCKRTQCQHTVTVFKDITVFVNTIDNTLERMVRSGIAAKVTKTDNKESVEYSVSIPK